MIRNVIFDWSGTLVDDLPAVWEATNYALTQARQSELTLDQFRAEFCLPFTRFYDRCAPSVPLRQLETWYHRRFREIQDSVRALPHAREFLQFCQGRQMRAFLLSSIHRDHYAAQSAATGFAALFERAYVQVRDKRLKIRQILRENGLRKQETLFVGDMEHDIEAARLGGIRSCAVLTGYNTLEQLRAAGPDLIVEHLGELRELLSSRQFPPEADRPAVVISTADRAKPNPSCAGRIPDKPAAFPIATVGALVFNRAGQVLMVRTHKWSDRWGIPGGKIKWGEPALAALRREIREETNLEIVDIRLVLVQDCIRPKEFYRDAHFILLNYTCRAVGKPVVKLNDEARAFRWLKPDLALTLLLNEPTRFLLSAVLRRKGRAGPRGRAEEANSTRLELPRRAGARPLQKGNTTHVENQHR